MTPATVEPGSYLSTREVERIQYINDANLRRCQKRRDRFQDVRVGIASVSMVEAWCVNKGDMPSVESE